jgi:hypothetical protein
MRAALRVLDAHKVNPVNDGIVIGVMDGPGHGGASHEYRITLPDGRNTFINFQNGPIKESGVNGLTHEVLLAILLDRLEGFQAGQYACWENADALIDLGRALKVLKSRTENRIARGVEGTHEV